MRDIGFRSLEFYGFLVREEKGAWGALEIGLETKSQLTRFLTTTPSYRRPRPPPPNNQNKTLSLSLYAASASAPPDAAAGAAASKQQQQQQEEQSRLAATARALLESDLSASLGLFPAVEETVFSFSAEAEAEEAAEGPSSLAEGAEALKSSSSSSSGDLSHRRSSSRRLRRRRALSGLTNFSSIISDDDIILPDDALVQKILSKDATVEKNLVAGLANLTRSGAFKEMLRAELQALAHAPERVWSGARAAGNATKAAWSYEKTVKMNGTNSALAQQQKETVARAVFRVLAVPRDLGEFGGGGEEKKKSEKKKKKKLARAPATLESADQGLATIDSTSIATRLSFFDFEFSTELKNNERCSIDCLLRKRRSRKNAKAE